MLANKEIKRGDDADLVFKVSGDVTSNAVVFIAKRTKSLTAARLIEKKNAVAGGSTAELEISYSSTTLKSTITVHLIEGNTQILEDEFLYFDVYDSTDNVTLAHGKLYLLADVQTPYDSGSVPSSELPVLNKMIYIVIEDGVITEESYWGFDTDPTATVAPLADPATLTLSSDAELELAGISEVNVDEDDYTVVQASTSSIVISWASGYMDDKTITYIWRYYSSSDVGQSTPITYDTSLTFGTTAQRPSFDAGTNIGFVFYDTTIDAPVWWNGSSWSDE